MKPGPQPYPPEERKRIVSIRLLPSTVSLIDGLSPSGSSKIKNRTAWIEQAIQEKLLREGVVLKVFKVTAGVTTGKT